MARPFVHGDSGRGTDVHGAGGAETFDVANVVGFFEKFRGDAVIFGAENEGGIFFEGFFVKLVGAWGVVLNGD